MVEVCVVRVLSGIGGDWEAVGQFGGNAVESISSVCLDFNY